jgi:hypothetical protein
MIIQGGGRRDVQNSKLIGVESKNENTAKKSLLRRKKQRRVRVE